MQPGVKHALDQQPVRTLDGDALDPQAHQLPAERADARLRVVIGRGQQRLARRVGDQHVVLA